MAITGIHLMMLIASAVSFSSCSKILLCPFSNMKNSRLLNTMKIGQMMAARNHSVHMLIQSSVMPEKIPKEIHVVPIEMNIKPMLIRGERLIRKMRSNPFYLVPEFMEYGTALMDALFGDSKLMEKLASEKYDVMFLDILALEAFLLRDYLNIPGIGYSNYGFSTDWDGTPPIHPGYMPDVLSNLSDDMTFKERLVNALIITMGNLMKYNFVAPWNEAKSKYNLNTTLTIFTTYNRLSLLVLNVDFVFDYPRPVFPWVKPISGLLFHPAKSLPHDLDRFVESSGEHGVIVMSFGSMIPELNTETASVIARVFARLPQKVIWRITNRHIPGLGNNTKVLPWLPQNDLLGHPKTRLFITHCGISGSHEALYHGVPVVAVPIFVDQFGHARKFVERLGMGEELDFFNITEAAFSETVISVLNNPSYFANAKRASAAVRDQPMNGKEELMYWVEYVIRHNGTLQFHSQAMERLNWFQYLLLDVIFVLVSIVIVVIALLFFTCRFVCRRVFKILGDKRKSKND